jgi:hypothetical protein
MVQRKVPHGPKPEREGPYTRLNVYVAIFGVIVTIFGVTFGYLALASTVHWPPFSSISSPRPTPNLPTSNAPTPTPQALTIDQAKTALLKPADLAGIDPNFTVAKDIRWQNNLCYHPAVKPTVDLLRAFADDGKITAAEEMAIYSSPADAHAAFGEEAQRFTCTFSSSDSTSDISSQISGTCDESVAWAETSTDSNGTTYSDREGIVQCNRAIVFFAVAVHQGSSFDNDTRFVAGISAAASKAEQLP